MAGKKQAVLVQRENDKGVTQMWSGANMEIDDMAGQVSFTRAGWSWAQNGGSQSNRTR